VRRLRQVLGRIVLSADVRGAARAGSGSNVEGLDKLFDAAELTIVDVGARGKGRAAFKHLAASAHLVACEPEDEEADRLGSYLCEEGGWRVFTIVREAIDSREGEAALHVTRKPGMSSLLRPDPAFTSPS
jgi:hypothetical protein